MTRSDSIAALAAALSTAQGQIKGALKDSDNPFFKSRYADLASCWEACRAALSQNGLALVQMPGDFLIGDSGATLALTTVLAHQSGEWISETMLVPVKNPDAQGLGSAITYGRRYALAAFVGIAPEDDDGEQAVGRGPQPTRKATAPPPSAAPRPGDPKPPAARIDALRRQASAMLQQLAVQGIVDQAVLLKDEPGSFAREALRRELLGKDAPQNMDEASWEAWVNALFKLREQHTPPGDLTGLEAGKGGA